MSWSKLKEVPSALILDGHRIRYKGQLLGYIKSGWARGLWLQDEPGQSGINPWFPPDGKTLADIAEDLEIEMKRD